jgi:type IV secretory pathway TrbF-like protein
METEEQALLPQSELSAELRALELGYQEIVRRDGTAERRAWVWQCTTWGLMGCLIVALVVVLVLLHRPPVQAFVQVVQVDDAGRVLQDGIPIAVLQYQPQDADWLTMLRDWVEATRWRGTDLIYQKHRWQQAGFHTCKSAQKALSNREVEEKPFVPSKKQTNVKFLAFTKVDIPAAYALTWEEHIVEGNLPEVTKTYTGSFTVGRIQPASLRMAHANPKGLCVASFQISENPPKK